MGEPAYLTEEGLTKIKAELHELVNVRRPALAQRLHFAIKQGDLSENADYILAKEEQGFLEGRILELEAMVRNAVLIDANRKGDGQVRMGSYVTVVESGIDDEETYYIVGPAEADPRAGRVSFASPMGQALINRKAGDRVKVQAPAGEIVFKIVKVA